MPNKKGKKKKHPHGRRNHPDGLWSRMKSRIRRLPSMVWWGLCIVVAMAYSWFVFSNLVEPFGFRWRALYGDPNYPEGYGIHGIDISHHQGKIEWTKLRNAMINRTSLKFVMVKATEGSDYIDENFYENFSSVRDIGIIRGAYHFWSNLSTAREQAYFFLDKVKLEAGDLPPVLDVENVPSNMSVEEFQMEILAWLHIVEDRYHVKPIIYTNYKFKETYLGDTRFDDYPYWIAHYYVSEVQYQGKWKFWQHTDVGKLPGIRGFVDLDIYNGSYYDLEMLTIKEENLEETEIPVPDSLQLYEQNDSSFQPLDEEEL